MAINVNTVYTTVLSILNKEQRGYLTPYEFNQVASQVQLDLFESFFQNLDNNLKVPQTDFDYSNPLLNIDDEISTFKCLGTCTGGTGGVFSLPGTDTLSGNTVIVYDDAPAANEFAFYRLGTITSLSPDNKRVEVERLQRDFFYKTSLSDMTAPSEYHPVYLYESDSVISILPNTITTGVEATFLRKPKNVVWAYTLGSVDQYVYNSSASVDFELSSNNQTQIILEILKYAGVVVRDPQIVQAAAAELSGK
tara:strand:+ start:458 stop:1210 length:753 start_codon:yes stop_codon:yes gene_type:complete